jgi:hypothetical protein
LIGLVKVKRFNATCGAFESIFRDLQLLAVASDEHDLRTESAKQNARFAPDA